MPRNDRPIPRQTEKFIHQEASSRCSFCGETSIPLLEIHHILSRADGGSNDPENLILVCRNCHARIGSGEISNEKVKRRKQDLRVIPLFPRANDVNANTLNIIGDVSDSIVAVNLTMTGGAKRSQKMSHPAGSIGANLNKKNYIAYLITRYHELRKADASYGIKPPGDKYNPAVIHVNIARKFKAKTYFLPESRFADLVRHLHDKIDRTIQGRNNVSDGYRNYSSFDEYIEEVGSG